MTTLLGKPTASPLGSSEDDRAEPAHPEFLAHHFDTQQQQYEAAKFGMWLFLATELLLFGGLFCVYTVFRGAHPEVFAYGSRFLDTTWGAINTVVLILSSLMMALAVSCAQRGDREQLVLFLALTLICAVSFLGVKCIEYAHKFHNNLVWGLQFYEEPAGRKPAQVMAPALPPAAVVFDAAKGQRIWKATCRSCHGVGGEGIEGQGKDIRDSSFIASKTDDELVAFLKAGRMLSDPLNTTGIQMPPKGGNPMLKDEDLRNVVAFIRTIVGPSGDGLAAAQPPEEFWIPRSSIPPAATGPPGLVKAYLTGYGAPDRVTASKVSHPTRDPNRPPNAHLFFSVYFLMTGLHGLHVLIGVGVLSWLLVRSFKGHFNSEYFTPVDLGGLYWHVVDVIWIFLFPTLYLIR